MPSVSEYSMCVSVLCVYSLPCMSVGLYVCKYIFILKFCVSFANGSLTIILVYSLCICINTHC